MPEPLSTVFPAWPSAVQTSSSGSLDRPFWSR
mgnify:CR=1 FL=1